MTSENLAREADELVLIALRLSNRSRIVEASEVEYFRAHLQRTLAAFDEDFPRPRLVDSFDSHIIEENSHV